MTVFYNFTFLPIRMISIIFECSECDEAFFLTPAFPEAFDTRMIYPHVPYIQAYRMGHSE